MVDNVLKGLSWNTLSTSIITLLFFVQYITLANKISIYEMGIVGVALIIIGLAQVLSDAGISNAIIFFDDINTGIYKVLTISNMFIGVALFLVFTTFDKLISNLFQYSNIEVYFLFISLNFLIVPIGQVSLAYLQKNLKFEIISKIDIVSVILSTLIFLVLINIYDPILIFLITQNIYYLIRAVLYVLKSEAYVGSKNLTFVGAFKFFKYGFLQMCDRILGYAYLRSEFLIIGILLGPTYLGMYTFINNIVVQPISRVIPIFNKVFLPHLSKLKNKSNKLVKIKLQMMNYLSLSILIVYVFIFSNLEKIIDIIDSKYSDAIVMGALLIILYVLRGFNSSGGILAYATGKTIKSIQYNILKIFTLSPLLVLLVMEIEIDMYTILVFFILIQIFLNYLNIKIIISPILNISSSLIIRKVKLPYITLISLVLLTGISSYFGFVEIIKVIYTVSCMVSIIYFIVRRKKFENFISNEF